MWHVQQASGHPRLTAQDAGSPVRVACDFYGPADPAAVVEGMQLALARDRALTLVVAVSPDDAEAAFGAAGAPERVEIRPAIPLVFPPDDPSRAVRGQRTASVRVAARLVRDHDADACVLTGPLDVALAATQFVLRLLPGATQSVIAADVGELILVDVSGRADPHFGTSAAAAILGSALGRSRGVSTPQVAVLTASGLTRDESVGGRRVAMLAPYAAAGLIELGTLIEAADVLAGRPGCQVVVTDGFSGNVLLGAFDAVDPSRAVHSTHVAGPAMPRGGGMVLGLEGVVVIGRASTAAEYADAVAVATEGHRSGLVASATRALADLVAWRRASAGLIPVTP